MKKYETTHEIFQKQPMIGSLFECIEGKVSPLNIWIAVAGFPTTIFLLIAAIQKGAAETREDDDRYMGGGGGGR